MIWSTLSYGSFMPEFRVRHLKAALIVCFIQDLQCERHLFHWQLQIDPDSGINIEWAIICTTCTLSGLVSFPDPKSVLSIYGEAFLGSIIMLFSIILLHKPNCTYKTVNDDLSQCIIIKLRRRRRRGERREHRAIQGVFMSWVHQIYQAPASYNCPYMPISVPWFYYNISDLKVQ